MGRQIRATSPKRRILQTQTFTFTIDVVVDPAAIADSHSPDERRKPGVVVADEITSNLESVSYVQAVTVRWTTTGKGE